MIDRWATAWFWIAALSGDLFVDILEPIFTSPLGWAFIACVLFGVLSFVLYKIFKVVST